MLESQRSLARMLVSTINERELESHRLSRKLHDEVGQVLSAVGLQLDVLKLDFGDRVPELIERTREIQSLLEQVMGQVRALSYDLNPAVVEKAGLQSALKHLADNRTAECRATVRLSYDPAVRIPLHVANAWYSIASHALRNSVQHLGATRVSIDVKSGPRGVHFVLRDNGGRSGAADAEAETVGLSVLLMEHYAAQADVRFVLRNTPLKGNVLRSTYTAPENQASGRQTR